MAEYETLGDLFEGVLPWVLTGPDRIEDGRWGRILGAVERQGCTWVVPYGCHGQSLLGEQGVDSGHKFTFHQERLSLPFETATADREGQHGRELVIVARPVLAHAHEQGMQFGIGKLGGGLHLQAGTGFWSHE